MTHGREMWWLGFVTGVMAGMVAGALVGLWGG